MSSSLDTASLISGQRAMQMGYAVKQQLNADYVICPPWTRSDIGDMRFIRESLDWLMSEIKSGCMLTEDRHGWTIRNVDQLRHSLSLKEQDFLAKAGFDPHQPRHPAGTPVGGRWSGEGGGGASDDAHTGRPSWGQRLGQETFGSKPAAVDSMPASTTRAKISSAVKHLEDAAEAEPKGWCAQYVRRALDKGGIKVAVPTPRSGKAYAEARDYGVPLEKAGFEKVAHSRQPSVYPPKDYVPKKGDVAVIQQTSRNHAGHMAMYSGKEWISDYKQWDFWPGSAYRKEKPDFDIYRMPEIE